MPDSLLITPLNTAHLWIEEPNDIFPCRQLRAEGSTTEHLKGLGALRIKCLTAAVGPSAVIAWVREVVMLVDEVPLLWALSLFPQDTMMAHPWIKTLNDQPLGLHLFGADAWQRCSQRLLRLPVGHDYLQRVESLGLLSQPLLRWSVFSRAGYSFDLLELFSVSL